MGPKSKKQSAKVWYVQPLTPLMEGPDPEAQGERKKKEKSWEFIRNLVWMRQISPGSHFPKLFHRRNGGGTLKGIDLRLILGVLACPLAPVPCLSDQPSLRLSVKDSPIEKLSARYIIHQYLSATGCTKLQQYRKSMYASGSIDMLCYDAENGPTRPGNGPGKNLRKRRSSGRDNGCFILWQMSLGMWLVELVVGGYKVVAGCNGKVVWRQLPWLGMNADRGPQRPLRRIIQGLDPKSTASMFTKGAQCLGEKRINDEDCFVLKVSADRAGVAERSDRHAEVIRHVLYGYFSQKSGLLVYIEDSHLTRVQTPGSDAVYWECTIGSSIEDYRDVDGVLIAHQGCSIATMFRFGEDSGNYGRRRRMEERWRIDDVVFNVPGLSMDCFIPPTEI